MHLSLVISAYVVVLVIGKCKSIRFCIIGNNVEIAGVYHWQCIGVAMSIALTIHVDMIFAFLLAFSLAMQLFLTCHIDVYSPRKLSGASYNSSNLH